MHSDVVEALKTLRRREMQMIGAAISTRNWHSLETAYNQARDRLDREILPALASLAPPEGLAARDDVLEEAAKVADAHDDQNDDTSVGRARNQTARDIAEQIRALKGVPQP